MKIETKDRLKDMLEMLEGELRAPEEALDRTFAARLVAFRGDSRLNPDQRAGKVSGLGKSWRSFLVRNLTDLALVDSGQSHSGRSGGGRGEAVRVDVEMERLVGRLYRRYCERWKALLKARATRTKKKSQVAKSMAQQEVSPIGEAVHGA